MRIPTCRALMLPLAVLVGHPAPAQVPPPPERTLVAGRVCDVLGDGIAAADVVATVDGVQVARTTADGEGIYQLRIPSAGAELSLGAPGKVPARLAWRGPTTARVRNVVLEDGGCLNGTVRDDDGQTVAGATIVAITTAAAFTTTSDAQGAYRFEALPLRRIDLRAVKGEATANCSLRLLGDQAHDFQLADPIGSTTVRVTGLPAEVAAMARVRIYGSTFAAVQNGGRLQLAADGSAVFQPQRDCLVEVDVPGFEIHPRNRVVFPETRRVEFTALPATAPQQLDSIRGGVRALVGGAVGNVRLVARDRSQCDLGITQATPGGEFHFQLVLPAERFCRFGLPLDQWLLVDDEMTIQDGFSWAPVTRPGERLDLLVERAGQLRGVVRGLGGVQFALADVVVADSARPWRTLLRTTTDRAGNIAFGLPAGVHDLLAVAHDGKVCRATLQVVAGQSHTIEWQPVPVGDVDGVLRDAQGVAVPGVELSIVTDTLRSAEAANVGERQRCSVRTDRFGRFRCRGLPPGTWFVNAVGDSGVPTTEVEVKADESAKLELAYGR